jgi:hypothetical protein
VPEQQYAPSALPSRTARALAFAAILFAGAFGALIGYGVVDVQCTGKCGTADGIGAVAGAVIAAVGVAIVAVLVLRAMGEWRTIQQRRAIEGRDEAPRNN